MSAWMALFTFINAWFITMFAVLPLVIEQQSQATGLDYKAAPKRIRWRRAFIINTVVAALATGALALIIKTGIVQVK